MRYDTSLFLAGEEEVLWRGDRNEQQNEAMLYLVAINAGRILRKNNEEKIRVKEIRVNEAFSKMFSISVFLNLMMGTLNQNYSSESRFRLLK